MKIYILGLLSLIFVISSCKTKDIDKKSNEPKTLTFGNSGGFSGATNEYYLSDDGGFIHYESRRSVRTELRNVDKQVVKQVFANFDKLGFNELELNDPGNLTNYLKLKQGDTEKVLKWGGPNDEVPDLLKKYFTNLMLIAKNNNSVLK